MESPAGQRDGIADGGVVRAVGVFSSVESPISPLNNRTTLPPVTSIGPRVIHDDSDY